MLGLIAALGVSQIPVVGSGASHRLGGASAEAIVQATRLGTDKQEVLVLLVPLLSSLVILVSLFVLSFREDWKPGGEEFRDKLRSERPERYAGRKHLPAGRYGDEDRGPTRSDSRQSEGRTCCYCRGGFLKSLAKRRCM